MFRKLVSNLPFSPALITEVGFYARRLRSEEVTRKTTVLFVALALVMQSLAVFSPPESVNASSEQDIIRGGVSNLDDFIQRYDNNEDDVKDIYTSAGITRSEILAAQPGLITPKDDTYIMSRYGQLTATQGEVSMTYQRSIGGVGIRYFSPLDSIIGPSKSLDGWTGNSAALGWFGIVQSSGSLATMGLPTSINPAEAPTLATTKTVEAFNLTQNSKRANQTTAKPLDKISYTLKLTNHNSVSVTSSFSSRISDILEYATLIDGGGGTLNQLNGKLSWDEIQLRPGESQSRTFAVQLLGSLPAISVGESNPASYDCKMTLSFGNSLNTPVACPLAKGVESMFYGLPTLGIIGNVTFGLTLLAVVTYFFIRTRQLKNEVRLIRHNFNTGII